jgi:chromosome segregation ATPase
LANLTRDVAAVQTQLAQAQAWNAKLESQLAYDLDWEKRAEEFQGDLSVRNQELEMTQAKLEEALMRASTQQDAIDQLREELTQKDNGDLQARQLVQQHEQTIARATSVADFGLGWQSQRYSQQT